MIEIILFVVGFVPWAIGMLTFFQWFKTPPAPNDQSNRLNNIASWWIGLTRPDVMGKYWQMWKMDLYDIIEAVQRDHENKS